MQTCTRCDNSGFLNIGQLPYDFFATDDAVEVTLKWIADNEDHDVSVCDCCGDMEGWYGEPGEHYGSEDPIGHGGPYAYNGGLCECH